MHQMVYLPLEAFDISGDLFGQSALFGTTIAEVPDVLIMHIGEGGLLNADGQPMAESELELGDIVEASFNMIMESYPGQVSVYSAQFVRHGGEEAVVPYQDAIDQLQEATIGGASTLDGSAAIAEVPAEGTE